MITMITDDTIRQFYRRLNHQPYGLTELVMIDNDTGDIVATGFFDNEKDFTAMCRAYNARCNIYAGRNPRPYGISGIWNFLNIVQKKRAKDRDIHHLTAISLDIDPIREKGRSSTDEQHQQAIDFALRLQHDIGGDVDDSGNGAYLWIPFLTPIEISDENFSRIKQQCKMWQTLLREKYHPEHSNFKIDGCFDFSRLKRVIGTFNHKAQRISGFVMRGEPDDKVREEILAIEVDSEIGECQHHPSRKIALPPLPTTLELPRKFRSLLRWDSATRKLWQNPDPDNDTSRHDWMLGMSCVEAGITKAEELAVILMRNPHGKYRRDGRVDYVRRTVRKLLKGKQIKVV
jgi:hypothetical protein